MLKFEPEKMPFHWYKVKNHSSGSIGNFNYRIVPIKDELLVSWWIGIYCYENTKEKTETTVPLTEEGLQQGWNWLQQQFEACDMEIIEKTITILDEEPYHPTQENEEEQAPF